jgi:hypothetical protein
MHDLDPASPGFRSGLLRDARRAFPQFYRVGSEKDVQVMDSLVLGHAAMTILINAPREQLVPQVRAPLELIGDNVDQLFTAMREYVRACPTFNSINVAERLAIERLVFILKPPVGQE